MPVNNGSATLASALASLQAQTLTDIEILVVDDHSSDATPAMLDKLASREARLRAIRLGSNLGVHHARAAGLEEARAPWIAFLDADDRALPTMLERLLTAAETSQADIAICGSLRVTPEGRSLGPKVRFPRQQLWQEEVFESFCQLRFGTAALWNKLYRSELIRPWASRPHRWQQNGTEDTLVNIGCFWHARRVVALPDVLHRYVLQPGSLTTALEAERGFAKIVRAFAIAVDLYAHLGPRALAGIADLYRAQLTYPAYALPWQTGLLIEADWPAWTDDLREPVGFLAQEHPQALALLLARLPATESPGLLTRLRGRLRRMLPARHG